MNIYYMYVYRGLLLLLNISLLDTATHIIWYNKYDADYDAQCD